MKRGKLRRFLFVAVTCLLSLPWLAPCGIGVIPATLVRGANKKLFGKDTADPYASDADILSKPVKPGTALIVHQNQRISSRLLVSNEEMKNLNLAKGKESIPQPPRPHSGKAIKRGATNTLEGFAKMLEAFDPVSWDQNNTRSYPGAVSWQQVVLSRTPLVVLEGDDLRIARHEKHGLPVTALASTKEMMARATIVIPEGTIFATAQRIHYRGPSSEIVLEGNPMVQFGHQELKAARPAAIMRLNFATRTVTVSSRAIETKF